MVDGHMYNREMYPSVMHAVSTPGLRQVFLITQGKSVRFICVQHRRLELIMPSDLKTNALRSRRLTVWSITVNIGASLGLVKWEDYCLSRSSYPALDRVRSFGEQRVGERRECYIFINLIGHGWVCKLLRRADINSSYNTAACSPGSGNCLLQKPQHNELRAVGHSFFVPRISGRRNAKLTARANDK